MKTVLDDQNLQDLLKRIEDLESRDVPRWGKMSAEQLICHLADQLRMALGEIILVDRSNFFHRVIGKRLALLGIMPRGVATAQELDYSLGGGTQPTEFANDKQILRAKLREFLTTKKPLAPHMLLGVLTREEWGAMIYLHMEHHLRQFGR